MPNYLTQNYKALRYAYQNPKINGIVLEGGSRSRKTWSVIEFLVWFCDENTGKDEFANIVLETAINSLESTVFESIAAELDLMNEKYPAFDSWKVFSDGVIHGAGENFLDRTGNEE